MSVSWSSPRREPRTRGSFAICVVVHKKLTASTPLHCRGALEAGVLRMTGIGISTPGSHFQQHQDLESPVPVPNMCDGHNPGCLHPTYRMVFLRSVHVTQAEPIRIFAKMVKTLVDTLEAERPTQRNRVRLHVR